MKLRKMKKGKGKSSADDLLRMVGVPVMDVRAMSPSAGAVAVADAPDDDDDLVAEPAAAALAVETAEPEPDPTAELVALAETMYRAAQARLEAAEARERSADERLAAAEERLAAAEERLSAADDLERTATGRLAAADGRERALAERIEAADARERAATERDAIANERDRAAAERDAIANERDRAAATRDLRPEPRPAPGPGVRSAEHELEIARLEAELERAHLDSLTGALRREIGRLTLRNEIERARRADGRFVLAFVDVDDLKGINDRDGHAAGDRVLRTLAATLRANLRTYDPVVRYGGDEFVCGVTGINPPEVEHRLGLIDQSLRRATGVGISAGLAALTEGETLEELTARADAALLEAKRSRNR